MNDAGADIGAEAQPGEPRHARSTGEALPVLGVVAFVDLYWNEQWSTSVGYSLVRIDNSDGQAPNAFHMGQYALANLLFMPVPEIDVRRRVPVRPPRQLHDGFDVNDLQAPVLVQVQLLVPARR